MHRCKVYLTDFRAWAAWCYTCGQLAGGYQGQSWSTVMRWANNHCRRSASRV